MQAVSRDEAKSMIQNGQDVTVVEVLGEDNYKEFHLPGAINVPVGDNFDEQIQKAVPDKSQAVLVYCHDAECNASPKAAKRMDELGFDNVYDYEAGKVDWQEAGLPIES